MIVVVVIGLGAAVIASIVLGGILYFLSEKFGIPDWTLAIAIVLSIAIGIGAAFFYAGTESGKAMIKSTKSSISGMDRIVRVYTADDHVRL